MKNFKVFSQNLAKFLAFCAVAFGISACDSEKSPKDLRAEFEQQMEQSLKAMLPLMSNETLPHGIEKCIAKAAADTMSDDEIKLIVGASFSERLNEPEKMLSIQQKLDSPAFFMNFLNRCYKLQ